MGIRHAGRLWYLCAASGSFISGAHRPFLSSLATWASDAQVLSLWYLPAASGLCVSGAQRPFLSSLVPSPRLGWRAPTGPSSHVVPALLKDRAPERISSTWN
eukprot:6172385-Pyramimonas_sp.AAC.1